MKSLSTCLESSSKPIRKSVTRTKSAGSDDLQNLKQKVSKVVSKQDSVSDEEIVDSFQKNRTSAQSQSIAAQSKQTLSTISKSGNCNSKSKLVSSATRKKFWASSRQESLSKEG